MGWASKQASKRAKAFNFISLDNRYTNNKSVDMREFLFSSFVIVLIFSLLYSNCTVKYLGIGNEQLHQTKCSIVQMHKCTAQISDRSENSLVRNFFDEFSWSTQTQYFARSNERNTMNKRWTESQPIKDLINMDTKIKCGSIFRRAH